MKSTKSSLKNILISLFILFSQVSVFSQPVSASRIFYLKGNLEDKKNAVHQAAGTGDLSLALEALDFTLSLFPLTGDDPDVVALAKEAVVSLKKVPETEDVSQVAGKLGKVFTTFNEESLRISALQSLSSSPSVNTVSIINSFVSEKVQSNALMDQVLLEAIKLLKTNGNKTSFNLLFVADILNLWPDYREQIEDSYGPLANNSEREILNILKTVPMGQKLDVLKIVNQNQQISKNIRGEVAEMALSESIYSIGESADVSLEQVELQLASLQIVADTKWTRAASLATAYFPLARSEYEHEYISREQFAKVISNVCAVASSDTGTILSSYLADMNKQMEAGNAPDETILLSVINALGGLGDKTAFDYLLYVTYLEYPKHVITAARSALAKLKW